MKKDAREEVRNNALKVLLGTLIFSGISFVLFSNIKKELLLETFAMFLLMVVMSFLAEKHLIFFRERISMETFKITTKHIAKDPRYKKWVARILLYTIFILSLGFLFILTDRDLEYALLNIETATLGCLIGSFFYFIKVCAEKDLQLIDFQLSEYNPEIDNS